MCMDVRTPYHLFGTGGGDLRSEGMGWGAIRNGN